MPLINFQSPKIIVFDNFIQFYQCRWRRRFAKFLTLTFQKPHLQRFPRLHFEKHKCNGLWDWTTWVYILCPPPNDYMILQSYSVSLSFSFPVLKMRMTIPYRINLRSTVHCIFKNCCLVAYNVDITVYWAFLYYPTDRHLDLFSTFLLL